MKSADATTVDEYGWSNPRRVGAHDYLQADIIALCKARGAVTVLDLGCGNGALSHALAHAGFDVVGCDADASGIAWARQGKSNARFEVMSLYDDPHTLGLRNVDVVVSAEVVEHLFMPRRLPRFAHALLKNDGHLIVTTPYHGYLKNLALSLANRWDHHHNPLWDGGHIKFWSNAMLTRLLEEEHFVIERVRGAGRLPYLWKSTIALARKSPG